MQTSAFGFYPSTPRPLLPNLSLPCIVIADVIYEWPLNIVGWPRGLDSKTMKKPHAPKYFNTG